jgi:hypothetical protein
MKTLDVSSRSNVEDDVVACHMYALAIASDEGYFVRHGESRSIKSVASCQRECALATRSGTGPGCPGICFRSQTSHATADRIVQAPLSTMNDCRHTSYIISQSHAATPVTARCPRSGELAPADRSGIGHGLGCNVNGSTWAGPFLRHQGPNRYNVLPKSGRNEVD